MLGQAEKYDKQKDMISQDKIRAIVSQWLNRTIVVRDPTQNQSHSIPMVKPLHQVNCLTI